MSPNSSSPDPTIEDVVRFGAKAIADAMETNRKFPAGERRVDILVYANGLVRLYMGENAPKRNTDGDGTLCPMSILAGRMIQAAHELRKTKK